MKLKQATLLEPVEPPKIDPAKIEEAVTLTTEVLSEMQSGALSVGDKEALGAKVLRQFDMDHFRECLKRRYLDGPGANITQAQTTIEKAREQHLAPPSRRFQACPRSQTDAKSFSFGRTKPQLPSRATSSPQMQSLRMIDVETVIDEYKTMKGSLQNNQRQFPPMLCSDLPTTPLEVEIW